MSRFVSDIAPALRQLVARVLPGSELVAIRRFGDDDGGSIESEVTAKGAGYGEPLELTVRDPSGSEQKLVFHTARPDVFGHDRRSDRAQEMLLGFDTFGHIPGHVTALDVGAIHKDGRSLVSVADTGEFYLLTRFAAGCLYSEDLRRIAQAGSASAQDGKRVTELATYLAALHREKPDHRTSYVRAIRDLVGSGEGIFGIVDGYPDEQDGVWSERLQRIEGLANVWRWRLKARAQRVSRIHGDFHPFNLLFNEAGELRLLDASRGTLGDPADDVTCLAINFPFFALQSPASWQSAFRTLYHRFWDTYLAGSGDAEVLEVAPPYLAWRGLVLANPRWYPALPTHDRERLLTWVEGVLQAERFDPSSVEAVFS